HVLTHVGGAVPAALHGLGQVEEREGGVQVEHHVHAGHADEDGLAAVAHHVDGLLDGRAEADHLEADVGATATVETHDCGDGIAVVGLYEVRGPEVLGHLEL